MTHKDDFNNVSAIVFKRWMAVCDKTHNVAEFLRTEVVPQSED